jgi:TolA-binding protein
MTLIASIRSEMRDLNGRMDELEHRQESLTSMAEQISSVSRRLPPPVGVPIAELELTERLADSQADTLLAEALVSVRGGKFKSAIDSLDKAIATNGARSYYLYWLGLSHELFGTLEKALGAYHECASSFTKDAFAPAALSRQAEVFVKLSDKNSAKLTLQKLISSYPGSTYSQNAKGRLKSL